MCCTWPGYSGIGFNVASTCLVETLGAVGVLSGYIMYTEHPRSICIMHTASDQWPDDASCPIHVRLNTDG